jgi:hypothetical protein
MVSPDEEALVRCETTTGSFVMKFERVSHVVVVVEGVISTTIYIFSQLKCTSLFLAAPSCGRPMDMIVPSNSLNENSLTVVTSFEWYPIFWFNLGSPTRRTMSCNSLQNQRFPMIRPRVDPFTRVLFHTLVREIIVGILKCSSRTDRRRLLDKRNGKLLWGKLLKEWRM